MNSKFNLKKLLITTLVPVLIFCIAGTTLVIEKNGYVADNNNAGDKLIDEDAWAEVRNENAGKVSSNSNKCLIVYDGQNEESVTVKDNVAYVLNSINVNVKTTSVLVADDNDEFEQEEITAQASIGYEQYDDVIFCIDDFYNLNLDIEELSSWVEAGGNIIFASGFEKDNSIKEWCQLLGIQSSDEFENTTADSLKFVTPILAGTEDREFSDDVINCEVLDVALTSDCVVDVETCDEEPVPLVWEKQIGNGKIIACNADIMAEKSDRGIVAALYSNLYSVYAYPVINAAVYCIDDCPSPTPAGYDDNIVSQYGYTVTDFISNVWMPQMIKIAEDEGVKYSTFVIQTYEDNVEGPFNNTDFAKSAKYYANMILSTGGEIGIHGYNHQPLVLDGFVFDEENSGYKTWPSVAKMVEAIGETIEYAKSLSDDIAIQSYVAPSNVISSEALHELQVSFEDLRVYAGIYIGTSDQLVQEFEVLENGTVYCPRLTADMQMEDSEWWLQINELNYHYVESNFIHPDDILDEERSDGGDFDQMVAGYLNMIEWNQSMHLKTSTISECAASVQRYKNLNYTQSLVGNTLKIETEGFIDEAYFMLRTNGKTPTNVEGGSLTKLNDNVYIVKLNQKNVSIEMV